MSAGNAFRNVTRLRVSLIWPEVVFVQIGALIAVFCRGLDYVLTKESPQTFSIVEDALPLPVWGALYMAAAILGIAGFLLPRLPITAMGHYTATILYFAFAVGSIMKVVGSDSWGFRTATGFIFGAVVLHFFLGDASTDAWREARQERERAKR